jgi:hypothetical protein
METKMADSEEDWIKSRAYRMWEEEGYPTGKDTEHWERARLEYAALKPAGKLPGVTKQKTAAKAAPSKSVTNGKAANGKHAGEAPAAAKTAEAKSEKTKSEKPVKAAGSKASAAKTSPSKTSAVPAAETLPKKRAKKATVSP